MIFFCLFAVKTSMISGIILNCEFSSFGGKPYECIIYGNLTTSESNRTVTEVRGNHKEGKTNDDVKKFFVYVSKTPYLPLNVSAFFKNLEIFTVEKSGVKFLTNDDLKGMHKLKVFDVSNNPIGRLEKGFFEGKSSIEKISFFKCQLRFVDKFALDPLTKLKSALFANNPCIDKNAFDVDEQLRTLKDHLKKCNSSPDQALEEKRDEEITNI